MDGIVAVPGSCVLTRNRTLIDFNTDPQCKHERYHPWEKTKSKRKFDSTPWHSPPSGSSQRTIAKTPLVYRMWARSRRKPIAKWEATLVKPYDTASKNSSALVAAANRSLFAEICVRNNLKVCATLYDLHKFFDTIDPIALVDASTKTFFLPSMRPSGIKCMWHLVCFKFRVYPVSLLGWTARSLPAAYILSHGLKLCFMRVLLRLFRFLKMLPPMFPTFIAPMWTMSPALPLAMDQMCKT